MEHCPERKTQILEKAQKRFAQYGFDKTTMQEIADDLSMSKGALYYYFPDKEALYKAIVIQEQEEFLQTLSCQCKRMSDPVEMLSGYAQIRFELSERLINLARSKSMYQQNLQSFIKETMEDLNSSEDQLIGKILTKGVQTGYFQIDDIDEMASLFNSLLTGMRIFFMRNKHVFLKQEDIAVYRKKVDLFLKVFCRSLQTK